MAVSPFILEANKYEPKMRSALIKAWNQLRTQESRAAIVRALQEGGVEAVLRMYQNIEPVIASQLSPVIDQALGAGASLPSTMIPAGAFLNKDVTVSLFNQATVSFLERYKLDLIQQIGANTREAVRTSLIADQIAGINPVETARNFRNTLGLTAKQEQSVRNYKTYLENLDTQALQRQLRDKRHDSVISRAIADQKPLSSEQIEKMTNRYRERYIKYRSETIARTEALRAVSIGNRAALDQMLANGDVDSEKLRRFWHYTGDSRTRQAHREIPGMNPDGRKLDEPFQTPLGSLMFPRDPNGVAANTIKCRCVEFYRLILADGKKKGPAPTDEKPRITVDTTVPEPKKIPKPKPTLPKQFIPAESIDDAQKYAEKHGFAQTVNFDGFPLHLANTVNQCFHEHVTMFPRLKNKLDYIGGSGEVKRRIRARIEQGDASGVFEKQLKWWNSNGSFACCPPPAGVHKELKISGVVLSDSVFKSEKTLKDITNNMINGGKTGFFPIGCGSNKASIDHELGHIIDQYFMTHKTTRKYLPVRNEVLQIKTTVTPVNIKNNLSAYATTNDLELIAEGWSEYLNNPNPRPIAKYIGDTIINNFAKKGVKK